MLSRIPSSHQKRIKLRKDGYVHTTQHRRSHGDSLASLPGMEKITKLIPSILADMLKNGVTYYDRDLFFHLIEQRMLEFRNP